MSGKPGTDLLKVEPLHPYEPFTDDELEQSIADRFETQVRRYSDRLAVRSEKVSYSYHQLNCLANRLACRILQIRGDAAEAVGLMFEHDAGVLAAMLGVLKTGKFYVVLDPDYPKDRLRYMLADSGAQLVVTDSLSIPLVADLSAGAETIINLDELEPSTTDENPGLKIAPDALAMLLYTSGSTGQPKGVMHSHRNVLVEARNLSNAWGISDQDRWLLYTSMSFANSVRTIYGGFLNGSAIYPYDLKKKGFGPLASWLNANQITIMRSLPTTFRNFMATLALDEKFPAMRILAVGGEPMPTTDLDYFNRHFLPSCVLVHGLGPTECFMVSWMYIPHGLYLEGSKLPIGYSLPDKAVLLLGDNGAEVAAGDVGEICVRSRYISLGYWRDSERTNAVFRPDDSGGLIYHTGDLGVRDRNGCLTHVGRSDFQMKIRGFRIEVAEIEAALRAIEGIADAVVVGRADASGDMRLIAYFVAESRRVPTVSQIRKQLASAIPDYMIPAAFVVLAEFPKTPNGKIDRRNLPAVSGERPRLDVALALPQTDVEALLSRIWSEVLGLSQVGIDDDFFDLGGDSLVAARVLTRVAKSFEIELQIKDLFAAPTVAGLARMIEENRAKPVSADVFSRSLDEIEATTELDAVSRLSRGGNGANASLLDPAAIADEIARRCAEMERSQRQALVALLRHAWQKSSFYRDLYSAAGIGERDLDGLRAEDLPIVDKKLLMDNFDQAVTDPRLKLSAITRWVDEVGDPQLDYLDDFIVCHSSGSSGTKGLFVCGRHDYRLASSVMASRLPEPVNGGAGKTKAAFYVASHGNFSAVSGAVRLPEKFYEPCILSMLDPEDEVVHRLNEFQPHQLYGYAGSIRELAELAIKGILRISPQRVYVGGEKLTLAMVERIRQAWAVPVFEFYSTSESKFVAFRDAGQEEMNVLDELNILEILDDTDRSVEAGQGGRAVLTNLYNQTLPIIRYDLGDHLVCGAASLASPMKTIKDIGGRTTAALPIRLPQGVTGRIDHYVLNAFNVTGLKKIQFVTLRPDHLRIHYIGAENLDAAIRSEFQKLLDRKGGVGTTFEVCRVPQIAVDPQTGKFSLVVVRH